MNWKDVPIPERMKKLPRDPRGLPVPFVILWQGGRHHFTVNDQKKVAHCLNTDRCAICGQPLFRGRWFVGGPLSAFHPDGWYIDTGLHKECMEYALQVCPYLAAPNYSGRLDDATINPAEGEVITVIDNTVIPERPKLFCAVMAVGQEVKHSFTTHYVKPKRPYRDVLYWREGRQLTTDEGEALVAEALRAPIEPRPMSNAIRTITRGGTDKEDRL